MKILMIVYIVISCLFCVSSTTYVTVDWTLERRALKHSKKKTEEMPCEPEPEPEPSCEPEPEPKQEIMPEIVEEIDAEAADEMISDALALSTVLIEEETEPSGAKSFVNIGVIDKSFEAGDVVTLAALRAKGLVPKQTKRVKILADGRLTKPLTVKANAYSVQAVKMIELTGGTVVLRKTLKK